MEHKIDIVKLCMVRDTTIPYAKIQISNPQDLADLGNKLIGDSDRENCVLVCLDIKNHINCIQTVSIGSVGMAILSPRELMKTAILSNSHGIALLHNHPSGEPEPSKNDIEITNILKECTRLFGIQFIDHVIIAGAGKFASLHSMGLIN